MFINMSLSENKSEGYWDDGMYNDSGTNMTRLYRNYGASDPVDPALISVKIILDQYIIPTALTLGTMANILIIVAFMATPLRRASLSHYFTAVAVADLAYILASFVVWVSNHGLDIYNRIGGCQLTTFTLLLSSFLATWFLLSAHVERCLVHFASGRTKRWCNIFRTKCVIIAIAIFSLVAFVYVLWTHVVAPIHGNKPQCFPMTESYIHIQNLRKVDVIFAGFIPIISMLVIDAVLLVKTLVVTRCPGRNEPSAVSAARLSTRLSHALERAIDLTRERNRSTVACAIIGILFAVLQLPAFYFRARMAYIREKPLRRDMYLLSILEDVVKFNAGYKIIVYILFLKSFRKALKHLFGHVFKKRAFRWAVVFFSPTAPDTSIESL